MASGSWPSSSARAARARARRRELAELCRRDDLPLPWGPYRAAPYTCYRCRRRIVVYTWVGHEPWSAAPPPPPPRPRTLALRRTLGSGGATYWANTCGHCGAVQGDNYLYFDGQGGEPPPFGRAWSGPRPELPGDVLAAGREPPILAGGPEAGDG